MSGSHVSKTCKQMCFENALLPGSKFPFFAIHNFISHIWEDGSRKVNNDEPDLRCFHGNFRPVISQAVRKPCFSNSHPRGQTLAGWTFSLQNANTNRLTPGDYYVEMHAVLMASMASGHRNSCASLVPLVHTEARGWIIA